MQTSLRWQEVDQWLPAGKEGVWIGDERKKRDRQRGMQKLLEVMGIFTILIVMMVS